MMTAPQKRMLEVVEGEGMKKEKNEVEEWRMEGEESSFKLDKIKFLILDWTGFLMPTNETFC